MTQHHYTMTRINTNTINPITQTTTLPITATLGMVVEMMGMVNCLFVGFCDIFLRNENEGEDDESGGGYLPEEQDHDDEPPPSEARANNAPCRTAAGYLTRTSEGMISFRFPYWGMRRCTRAKFFDKRIFPVLKPVPLHPTLASALGYEYPVVIVAGRYEVRKVGGGFEIIVAVWASSL
jgi:hypothetical protein